MKNHCFNTFFALFSLCFQISFATAQSSCPFILTGDYALCPNQDMMLYLTTDFPAGTTYTLDIYLNGALLESLPPTTEQEISYSIPFSLFGFGTSQVLVMLKTFTGCTSSQYLWVMVSDLSAQITGPECLPPGTTAELTLIGNFSTFEWLNMVSNPSLTTISISEPGIYCASVQDSLGCQDTICLEVNAPPNVYLTSDYAFCEDNPGPCQQVCANSTVIYTAEGITHPNTELSWSISGAESYEINGQQAIVNWGTQGQGSVAVVAEIPGIENYPILHAFPGQYVSPSSFNPTLFLFVTGGLMPYQVSAFSLLTGSTISPSSSSNENGGVLYIYENSIPGDTYTFNITDASGNTLSVEEILFDPDNPNTCLPPPFYPIITQPSSCDTCNGGVAFSDPLGTFGSPTYSIVGDITLSNLTPPLPPIEGLCPGYHNLSVVSEEFPFCAQPMNFQLACSNNLSCTSSDQICVSILPEPQAAFISEPPAINDTITICKGQSIVFQNTSTGGTTYVWNFGDGQLTDAYEPAHTYLHEGYYPLSLITRNNCYCSDTTRAIVHVLSAEIPEINCTGTVCEGQTATYTSPNDCDTYLWSISPEGTIIDGGSNTDNFVVVQWSQGPEGFVELSTPSCAASGLCPLSNRISIPIITDNVSIQGNASVCFQSVEEYSITDFGSGTSFNWTVSGGGTIIDGQNTHRITVIWNDQPEILGNPQWVAVEYENCYLECSGQAQLDVLILPEFYAFGPPRACENSTQIFTALNALNQALVPCHWQVLDQEENPLWSSPTPTSNVVIPLNFPEGTYTILAQADNPSEFCQNSYRTFVQIEAAPPPPAAIDGSLEICPGTPYVYEAVGLLPEHHQQWTINDGNNSWEAIGNTMVVSWGETPPYELSVAQLSPSALQCPSETISINPQTLPPFSLSGPGQICPEDIATINMPDFANLTPQWSISDEETLIILSGQGTSSLQVQGLQAGTATISVSVCGLSANLTLTVSTPPDPQIITPAGLCIGEVATVQTTQTYPSYAWYDENGNLLSTNPTADLGPGTYLLEITDNNGCPGSKEFQILAYPQPYAQISVPQYAALCPGTTINLHATTTESGYGFQWYFNGNPLPGATSSVFEASQTGTYSVEITNAFGCTNTSPPKTIFSCEDVGGSCSNGICVLPGAPIPLPGCTIDETPSHLQATTADCHVHEYTNTTLTHQPGSMYWIFYDTDLNIIANPAEENPVITFPNVLGFYPYWQIASMPNSATPGTYCEVAVPFQDTVKIAPDFIIGLACVGEPVSFTAHSQILAGASISGYAWDFGDPASGAANTSLAQNPTHVYNSPGEYEVTLTVTEASGCQVSITKTISIPPPPVIDFTLPAEQCEDLALQFTVQANENVAAYAWDFGDPASGSANNSSFENPFHHFAQAGTYDITLTVTDFTGCSYSISHPFTVQPNLLSGAIGIVPDSVICPGDTAQLTAPGSSGDITYLWSTGSTEQEISTAEAGVFGVSLTDANGCFYTPDQVAIKLLDPPIATIQAVEYNEFGQPVAVFENNYTTCEGEDVFLEAVSASTEYTYVWSTGEPGNELSFTEERDNQLPPGTYDFTLTITDTNGCSAETGPFTVTVHPTPEIPLLAGLPAPPLCEGQTATLSVVNADPTLSYIWNTGETGTQIEVVAAGLYYVRATSAEGCSSESEPMEVFRAPDIGQVPSGCFTRCNPDTICLPPFPAGTVFQWYLNDTPIPAPAGNEPDVIATQSGIYVLEIEDQYGCNSTSNPLDLTLEDPLGSVSGQVWFDVNQNGLIDAGDTLVPGINILLQINGINEFAMPSDVNGNFSFNDVPANNYLLLIDPSSLPYNWGTIIDSLPALLQTCNDETSGDFLLTISCNTSAESVIAEICPGDSIEYAGQYYFPGDTDTLFFVGSFGCDSTVFLQVNALPTQTESLNFQLCPSDSLFFEGQYLYPGDVLAVSYINQYGCDSTVNIQVTEFPQSEFDVVAIDSSCWNKPTGSISIQPVQQGAAPYTYSLDGTNFQDSPYFQDLPEGEYLVQIMDANGCLFEETITLPSIEPLTLLVEDQILSCEEEGALLQPALFNPSQSTVLWLWEDGSKDSTFFVSEAGQYLLTVSNQCETIQALIHVSYEAGTGSLPVYVANAFSPNADGINDCFRPEFSPNIEVLTYSFRIFDRWGNFLFETASPQDCWNGSFRDQDMDPGVYVWYLEATVVYCHQTTSIFKKGGVTLVR